MQVMQEYVQIFELLLLILGHFMSRETCLECTRLSVSFGLPRSSEACLEEDR